MPPVPWWTIVSAVIAPVVLATGVTVAASRQPADGYDPLTSTLSALAAHGATDRWVMTTAVVLLGLAHSVTALGLRAVAPPGRFLLGLGGVATALVAAFPQADGHGTNSHAVVAGLAFGTFTCWPALAGRRGPGRRAVTVRPARDPVGPARAWWQPRRTAAAAARSRPGAPPAPATLPRPATLPEFGALPGPAALPGSGALSGPETEGAPWPLRPWVGLVASAVSVGLVAWFVVELVTHARPGLPETAAVGAMTLWPLVVVLGLRLGRTPGP